LALLARRYDLGFNIDAEERATRHSLDLLERSTRPPPISGWEGLGFVIQRTQNAAPMWSISSSIWPGEAGGA